MLDFPQPCPSCGRQNENHWCYNFISRGELIHACKREGTLLDGNTNWTTLPITDKEGTPLKKPKLRKVFSPAGLTDYIYTDIHTDKPVIKKTRNDDGYGTKSFVQYNNERGHWNPGLASVNRDNLNLYQFEKIYHTLDTKIYIVEGEKVAEELWNRGIPATCAIGGPHTITDAHIKNILDREIILIPDADAKGMKAMDKLRKKLLKYGVIAKWILPFYGNEIWDKLPEGGGVDAYDWVKTIEKYSDFKCDQAFFDKAEKESADRAEVLYDLKKVQEREARNNALEDISQIFIKPTITIGSQFYIWDGTHYAHQQKWEIEQRIFRHMEVVPIKKYVHGKIISILDPTVKRIHDVFTLAKSKFKTNPEVINQGGINCANGTVIYDKTKKGRLEFKLVPHSPKRIFTYKSNCKYDPNASTEYFDKLMMCLDEFQSEILFRTLGASLEIDTVRAQKGRTLKSLIMQGYGSNGKDSIRECLKLLMGGNIGTCSLQDFKLYDQGKKFAVAKIAGKNVNWCSENASLDLGKIQSLKSAITGEEISIERKGKEEQATSCKTIFIFNMNTAPEIRTDAESIMSRFCVLKFDKTFKTNAKASRGEIEADPRYRYDFPFIEEEILPAFLNAMLKGLADVLEDGVDYSKNQKHIEEIQKNTNHLWRFVEDVGLSYGEGVVTTKEIYSQLVEWYYSVGNLDYDEITGKKIWYDNPNVKDKNLKSINVVASRISELFPRAKIEQKRTEKQRTTMFYGLSFNKPKKDDEPDKPDDTDNRNNDNDKDPKPTPPSPSGTELTVKEQPKNTVKEWTKPSVAVGETLEVIELQPEENVETIKFANPYKAVKVSDGKVNVDTTKLDIYNVPEEMNLPTFKPKEIIPFESLKPITLDIETTGLDANEAEIISIGLRQDGKNLIINRGQFTEEELIYNFTRVMRESKATIIVGHNIYNFDLPFIEKRAQILDVPVPYKQQNFFITITASSINGKPISYQNISWSGVNIIDTFHLVGMYDKMTNSLSAYGLKQSVIDLKLREERRTELTYEEILGNYNAGNWEIIDEYLEYDLEDTELLTNLLLPQIYYQLMVVPGIDLQQLAVASPAKKWEKILENYYREEMEFPAPDAKLSYEGGLVKVYPGLYQDCAKIDVSGMYPSIQMTYNLKSRKDVDGIYLSVLNFLTTERTSLKSQYKQTGLLKYNAMQNAYKILNNGGYGFSGTGGYPFNCMLTAALVTAYGRLIVQKMIDVLIELNCEIIEVDTDGIYFCGKNQKEVYELVQSQLPKGIGIELEHQGVDIYSPMMKNYIIFNGDKITVKGSKFKSRTKCRLLKEFVPQYVNLMRTDKKVSQTYYDDIISSLMNHTFDLEMLKEKKRIPVNGKALVEAGIGKPGDVVTYYFGGHITKRGCVKNVPVQSGEYLAEYYIREVTKLKQEVDEVVSLSKSLVTV